MTEKDFKKLLEDLQMNQADLGRMVGRTRQAVRFCLRGDTKSWDMRGRIRRVLEERATELNVPIPDFWLMEKRSLAS